MVKIFVRNDKLYLEKAGKEVQLESATISHYQVKEIYEIIAFILLDSRHTKRVEYKQKTYPLVDIKLEKSKAIPMANSTQKAYSVAHGKYYYINYYVY